MKTPYSLDFSFWDCWPLDPLPNEPGVYVIMFKTRHPFSYDVLYIGSSSCLIKRIANHEMLREKSPGSSFRVFFRECNSFRELEIDMIRFHSPLANVQHNGHE